MYFYQGVALVCFCKDRFYFMDLQNTSFSVDGLVVNSVPVVRRSISAPSPLKSVPESPSYCCSPGYIHRRSKRQLSLLPDRSNAVTLGLEQAIRMLCAGGYRISEVLSVKWSDVISEDRVIVKGKKRGTASIAIVPGVSVLLQSIPPSKRSSLVFSCDYGQVYRRMLQLGFAAQPEGHVNRTVTHTPRHLLAQQVAASGGLVAASNILHHKSLSSISHYVPYVPPKEPELWLYWDQGQQLVLCGKNDFTIDDKHYVGRYFIQSQNERCSWAGGWAPPLNPLIHIPENQYPWDALRQDLEWCPVWYHTWSWQIDLIVGGKLYSFSGSITPA